MTIIPVRVTARHQSGPNEDPLPILQFDFFINEETRSVIGDWTVFGIWGSHNSTADNLDPIVLLSDGRIDFGATWAADRHGTTSIRDKKIKVGEYFEVQAPDNDLLTYGISRVVILGVGDA